MLSMLIKFWKVVYPFGLPSSRHETTMRQTRQLPNQNSPNQYNSGKILGTFLLKSNDLPQSRTELTHKDKDLPPRGGGALNVSRQRGAHILRVSRTRSPFLMT